MQVQELTVNDTSVVFITSDNEGKSLKTYEKPFNESAFKELMSLFEENEFLQMNESYTPKEGQPVVTDVGTLEISLINENSTKTVKVDPYYFEYMPEELQEIDSELVKLRAYAVSLSPEKAENISKIWVETAPTYSFDGLDLKMEKHEVLETIPEQHLLTYTFTSTHGGYGNRTDQIVTQVLTPHIIEVTVSEKNVTSAVIDRKWDELSQEPVESEFDTIEENGSVNKAGESGEENPVEIKYLISEGKTPWDQWYEDGNIQFIKAPTELELIIAYYGTVYNIELFEVNLIEGNDINSSIGSFYVAKVKESDFNKMKDLGWTDF